MSRSRWLSLALTVPLLAGITLLVVPARAAQRNPTLGLLAVLHHVDATRFPGDSNIFANSGVYIAALNGAFEVDDYTRPGATPALWQVSRDTHGVRRIRQIEPAAPLHPGGGIPRFFTFVVRSAAGTVVSTSHRAFCPGDGYGLSRTDASGPDRPQYPYYCGSSLTRAMVLGLDQGWAGRIDLSVPFKSSLPDGAYTLTVSIAATYASQLEVPAGQGSVTVQLAVKTGSYGCKIVCPPVPDAALAPTGTAGEGPQAAATGGGNGNALTDGVPDLRALPAHHMRTRHVRSTGRDYLDFGATIWNGGSGPLVVEGYRSGDTPLMSAQQFIYRDGRVVTSQVVGQFEYDTRKGHNHWHMEDVAQYDLLNASGARVLLSGKQSFCLAPTDPIDLTAAGASWQPDTAGLWSACADESSIWLREVLTAGWGDTYYQSVAGQSFDITHVANGQYQVRVTTDPNDRLIETNYDNNSAVRTIYLGGTAGHRTVKLLP